LACGFFLTELIDPLQQRLQFTWDAQLRLMAITESLADRLRRAGNDTRKRRDGK